MGRCSMLASEVTTMKDALMNMKAGGRDKYSNMKHEELMSLLTPQCRHEMITHANRYMERNSSAVFGVKEMDSAARWVLRGCPIHFAVRRAQIDALRYDCDLIDSKTRHALSRCKSGRDALSKWSLEDLRNSLSSEDTNVVDQEKLFRMYWRQLNSSYWRFEALTEIDLAQMWRWFFRGMTVMDAATKVWIDRTAYSYTAPPESEFE